VGMTFEIALRFETICDEGRVRGFAAHSFGEFTQRHGPTQLPQRDTLGDGQAESRRPNPEMGLDLLGQAVYQAAELAVGLGAGSPLITHDRSLLQLE
jgi:hypothetical protein